MVARVTQMVMAMLFAMGLFGIALPSSLQAYFYPDDGDMYYDGYYFADSYFKWVSAGPWQGLDPIYGGLPTYEHDLHIDPSYFTGCTSWTNLPNGYDDCPTVGVEENELWVFTFGSFEANLINSQTWYYGLWSFSGGTNSYSTVHLAAQEGYHRIRSVSSRRS